MKESESIAGGVAESGTFAEPSQLFQVYRRSDAKAFPIAEEASGRCGGVCVFHCCNLFSLIYLLVLLLTISQRAGAEPALTRQQGGARP